MAVAGIVCTLMVYVIEHLGGILQISMSFNGICTGPLLGIFTLGVLFPQASSKVIYFHILYLLFITHINYFFLTFLFLHFIFGTR